VALTVTKYMKWAALFVVMSLLVVGLAFLYQPLTTFTAPNTYVDMYVSSTAEANQDENGWLGAFGSAFKVEDHGVTGNVANFQLTHISYGYEGSPNYYPAAETESIDGAIYWSWLKNSQAVQTIKIWDISVTDDSTVNPVDHGKTFDYYNTWFPTTTTVVGGDIIGGRMSFTGIIRDKSSGNDITFTNKVLSASQGIVTDVNKGDLSIGLACDGAGVTVTLDGPETRVETSTADAYGSVIMLDLTPGDYIIYIDRPGYPSKTLEATIIANDLVGVGLVTSDWIGGEEPGGTKGTLSVDTLGNADVTAVGPITLTSTDVGGHNFGEVPIGTYIITMEKIGYRTQTKTAIVLEGQLTIITADAWVGADAPPILPPDQDADADADGLPDSWEMQYFGNLNENANGDYDGDNATNYEEYVAGTDPTIAGGGLGWMPIIIAGVMGAVICLVLILIGFMWFPNLMLIFIFIGIIALVVMVAIGYAISTGMIDFTTSEAIMNLMEAIK